MLAFALPIVVRSSLLLAQTDPKDLEAMRDTARTVRQKPPGTDLMLVLGVFLALAAVLFFWAFFIRKRPKHARGALVVNKGQPSKDAEGSGGRRRRRKRRPDHPDNWGRNPTLGETGGLPPARSQDQDGPPSEPQAPPAH